MEVPRKQIDEVIMKKGKSCGCGHEGKEKGKKGKGYVEIEIKMGRMPKKQGKRK